METHLDPLRHYDPASRSAAFAALTSLIGVLEPIIA